MTQMNDLEFRHPVERKTTFREVIIIAVILIVLAVIVSVIFLKQQDDARRVAGSRNLQQWGIALNLYLIDHDNQLPEVGEMPVTPEQTRAWYNDLPPYISQSALADLPAGERPRPGVPSLWTDPSSLPVRIWDASQFYFQYGMNRALQPDPQVRSFNISELYSPGKVVMLAPIRGFSPAATPEGVVFQGNRPTSPLATAFVLFCDGHVESVTRAQLVDNPEARLAKSAAEGKLTWFEK